MVDDNVFTELNFEVTGGGLSDLQRLATLLGAVDKVAGDLTQNLSASSKGFNAQARAIRNAAKAYESYVAAQYRKAVFARAKADLMGEWTSIVRVKTDAQPSAQETREALLAEANFALRSLKGLSRAGVSII